MIEFSSPPKYIIVNRKNILMAAALGVHNDWLFLLGNLFSANTFYVFRKILTCGNTFKWNGFGMMEIL